MTNRSYKEQIKYLAHKHKDTVDHISTVHFYYSCAEWPDFIKQTSEHYQQPTKKVVDDLDHYRNSFQFQKDRKEMEALLAQEAA